MLLREWVSEKSAKAAGKHSKKQPKKWLRFLVMSALLIVVLVASGAGVACEFAAGVVPFSTVNEEIFVLIAEHKINPTRGWAAFGGCVDKGESTAAAALRELHEETRCALNPTLTIDEQTPSVTFGKFTSFALQIPFVPAEEIARKPLPAHCKGLVFQERGPWAWVELSELLGQFRTHENRKHNHNRNAHFSNDFLPDAKHRWFWSKSSRVIDALHEEKAFR